MMEEYSYNPSSPSWFRDPRHVAMLSGALVLAVILIGGAVWFVRARQASTLRRIAEDARTQAVQVQLEDGIGQCALAPDPEACKAREISDAARNAQALALCDSLSGSEKDGCVRDYAISSKDVRVCKKLSESVAAECEGRIRWIEARGSLSLALCKDIGVETMRKDCEEEITVRLVEAGKCGTQGVDEALCEDKEGVDQAILAQDPSLCDRLHEAIRMQSCRVLVEGSDLDSDGLAYVEELEAKTDPRKADTDLDGLEDKEELRTYRSDPTKSDTDGDGFDDGTEVKNGYSPVGSGKLSSYEDV